MEDDSVSDSSTQLLLDAASDFSCYPGTHSDVSTKQFLDRFPLPIIINALEREGDVPGLENVLVVCLERVFRTKYGSSLIPQYMPFVAVGMGAHSQKVKYLACKTVAYLLENSDVTAVSAVRLVAEYDVYPLLLKGLIDGDEQVAAASMDAIKNLAGLAEGIDIIFPANVNGDTHLRNLAARCSSLGRVRILALVVKLFSISRGVASVVYSSNLLSLLMAEVSNVSDTLVTLSGLELLYELAEIEHSTEFLSKTTVLQLLSSLISSDMSTGSILRSRAMMITGRLMSRENTYMFVDEFGVQTIISVISRRLGSMEKLDEDECECAIESLGQIGASMQGAALLFSGLHPAARHLVNAAFDRCERGKQLAALHALGNVVGETRSESKRLLSVDAEESLKLLIYEAASKSMKFTPSGIFLSVLQQESDVRLAGYRLMAGLATRPWCLMEICARQEIINILSDAFTETTKIGMEARHSCCQAIYMGLLSSPKLKSDTALAGVVAKLDAALKRGPYLARVHLEAQPAVMTADRF